LGYRYHLTYLAPSYLDADIKGYATHIGAASAQSVGTVYGCPNVLYIGDPQESGDQKYEMVLEDHFRCDFRLPLLRKICADCTDILILPGGFDLRLVLRALRTSRSRVHIDSNVEPAAPKTFEALRRPVSTIMMSTSSTPFLRRFRGSPTRLRKQLHRYAEHILLKENRGGSRLFLLAGSGEVIAVPSHPRRIRHSIGVGDCFDAVFVALRTKYTVRAALAYASLIAAEYACEIDLLPFRKAVRAIMRIPAAEAESFRGVQLPWEERRKCNVYIAGPDFANVDSSHIDAVVRSLEYHNFSPRCPIREHGEVESSADSRVKLETAQADLSLLDKCQLVVAVLLFDDPGTLIEIGMALEKGRPVIVYDPHKIASNLMLTSLPNLVSVDLDEVITRVFVLAASLK
jgi:nucleoside 2-deoxyribosyltransferase